MEFIFRIFWTENGRFELLEPSPRNLPSMGAAHRLARNFAAYVPVKLITIEAEDGSISELWFSDGRCEDIVLAAD